ncbi:MAG: DUF4215 domain-containing protein [Myxococcales bacterium]|nr:DUF4215 domain-containing protein [Myxococcales bacterium]
MTDFTLSEFLTDGFTQTSAPTDPTTDDTTTTTDTTVGPTSDPTSDPSSDPTSDPSSDPTSDPTETTIGPQNCGNGAVETGEECDDGNQSNADACVENCVAAVCGDGFVFAGVEQCDDGNSVPDDGCDNECASTTCGNGVVDPGEDCDDGNLSNTDACLNSCQGAFCGDNFVQAGVEQCDDGNPSNTDACAACKTAVCGDGFVHSGVEDCDDGNDDPNDGCDECSAGDLPAECQGITVLDDATRNVAQSGPVECDEALPVDGQWTRFTGAAGTLMPVSAPAPFSCGTHAPGWLSGALPTEAEGIVTRDVCFNWDGNQCNWKVPISVRNCGPFTMFKLVPVPACALRYCATD